MNICTFIGRTTKDIELRYTQSTNKAVGNFTLAVDDGYGDNKHTSFFDMTVWDKAAEAMQKYVPKGTKIAVTCRAGQTEYTAKDGTKKRRIGFVVTQWEFAQSRAENTESERPAASPDDFMDIPDDLGDELPFN